MPADDRETKFERALEQHLRAGSSAADCPDAETLAAYHERSLSLEEMAHWKQHIAGCAQCQEMLSLVEVTEKQLAEDWEEQPIPAVGAAAASQMAARKGEAKEEATSETDSRTTAAPTVISKRRPKLAHWAIPIGAVAAGVLVWIGIHQQQMFRTAQSQKVQVAENRPQAVPVPNLNPEVAPKTPPPVVLDRERDTRNERATHAVPEPADKESRDLKLATPSAADTLRKDESAAKKQAAPEAPAIASGNMAAAPPPSPAKVPKPGPRDVVTETVEANPAAPSVQATGKQVELPAAGVAGGATDQKYIGAMKAKSAPAPPAAAQQDATQVNTNAMMYSQGVSPSMIQASAAGSGVILTPDHKVWWKIAVNGSVEVTTDAGKSWKTLVTGAAVQLTSGAAPSSKVCWIAGHGGTLLLTTDRGGHWKSLTTPIAGDLGGVHAVDAKHATIWDMANRVSYETSDGGATWKQVANE